MALGDVCFCEYEHLQCRVTRARIWTEPRKSYMGYAFAPYIDDYYDEWQHCPHCGAYCNPETGDVEQWADKGRETGGANPDC